MYILLFLIATFAGFCLGVLIMLYRELYDRNEILNICERVINQMERRDVENKTIVDYLVKEHKKRRDEEESVRKGL